MEQQSDKSNSYEDSTTSRQSRVLSIRHAVHCNFEEGKCPDLDCVKARKCKDHIYECEDKNCTTLPHCVSTRADLEHFQNCKNERCDFCRPFRYQRVCFKLEDEIYNHLVSLCSPNISPALDNEILIRAQAYCYILVKSGASRLKKLPSTGTSKQAKLQNLINFATRYWCIHKEVERVRNMRGKESLSLSPNKI